MTVSAAAPVVGGFESQRSWPQSSVSGTTSERIMNLGGMGSPQALPIALKARVWSVSAASTGRRSIEEAP